VSPPFGRLAPLALVLAGLLLTGCASATWHTCWESPYVTGWGTLHPVDIGLVGLALVGCAAIVQTKTAIDRAGRPDERPVDPSAGPTVDDEPH